MNIVIGVIVGMLVLMFLVTAHEFGHFLAARRNGVSVTEFGIGFPPRAIAWIKDPQTGKWRRLPKSEWTPDKLTKVVHSESKSGKNGKNVEGNAGSGSSKNSQKNHAELKRDGYFQKGMIFSLNWLPIGGFCQMDGESDAEKRPGTLGAASFWSKTKVLFAGVTMNWLVAIVILTILAWAGMPEFLDGQFTVAADTRTKWVPVMIKQVLENSPGEQAGLQAGDYLLAVDGQKIAYGSDVTTYNNAHAGQTIKLTILRGASEDCLRTIDWDEVDWSNLTGSLSQAQGNGASAVAACEAGHGELSEVAVTLNQADAEYLVGIMMSESDVRRYSTWSAPLVGVGLTAQLTGETFKGVGQLIWNLVSGVGRQLSFDASVRQSGQEAISSVGDSVSGPVGIIGVLFPAFTSAGPASLAFLTALISVSLACMNVLPIPALDGGRWLLIALFKLRKKELTKEIEEKIVSRAFMVLLAIVFIVTVLDIMRIVR